jgi:hypothetical protein
MYHVVTFTTKNFTFRSGDFCACPFRLPTISFSIPPCGPDNMPQGLSNRCARGPRLRSSGKHFCALFQGGRLILPWTSQAACLSRASLPRSLTCTTVIHIVFIGLVMRAWEARLIRAKPRSREDKRFWITLSWLESMRGRLFTAKYLQIIRMTRCLSHFFAF